MGHRRWSNTAADALWQKVALGDDEALAAADQSELRDALRRARADVGRLRDEITMLLDAREPPESQTTPTTARTIKVFTALDPKKGWRWLVTYQGERVANSHHHVPLEIIAIRKALSDTRRLLLAKAQIDCSPEELVRADRWEEDARRQIVMQNRLSNEGTRSMKRAKAVRVPVRLSCGHVRMVKPNTQTSDNVNCGPCGTHRTVDEFVEFPVAEPGT